MNQIDLIDPLIGSESEKEVVAASSPAGKICATDLRFNPRFSNHIGSSLFDAFSSRKPVSTSLENALKPRRQVLRRPPQNPLLRHCGNAARSSTISAIGRKPQHVRQPNAGSGPSRHRDGAPLDWGFSATTPA